MYGEKDVIYHKERSETINSISNKTDINWILILLLIILWVVILKSFFSSYTIFYIISGVNLLILCLVINKTFIIINQPIYYERVYMGNSSDILSYLENIELPIKLQEMSHNQELEIKEETKFNLKITTYSYINSLGKTTTKIIKNRIIPIEILSIGYIFVSYLLIAVCILSLVMVKFIHQ